MSAINIIPYQEKYFEESVSLINDLQSYFSEIDERGENVAFKSDKEVRSYFVQILKDAHEMNGVIYLVLKEDDIVGVIQGVVVTHENNVLHRLSHNTSAEGWIGLLYVRPEYRKQHLAKKLVLQIEKHFKAKNCKTIRLIVGTSNKQALNFYDHLGFSEYERKLVRDIA